METTRVDGVRFNGHRKKQVHLVAVEVGVVRRRDGQVQSKCGMVQDFHAMRHDRHLVERGLSVKNNEIVISEMSFDDEPRM